MIQRNPQRQTARLLPG